MDSRYPANQFANSLARSTGHSPRRRPLWRAVKDVVVEILDDCGKRPRLICPLYREHRYLTVGWHDLSVDATCLVDIPARAAVISERLVDEALSLQDGLRLVLNHHALYQRGARALVGKRYPEAVLAITDRNVDVRSDLGALL